MALFNTSIDRFVGGVLSIAGTIVAYLGGPWAPLGYAMIIAGGALMASAVDKPKEVQQVLKHQVNTKSSRTPLPLIYGEMIVGVNKTFYHSAAPYLHIICEIGEGEIHGIVREDGTAYTDTATQLPTDNPPVIYFDEKRWDQYDTSKIYMEFYNGAASQTVCTTLRDASAGKWMQALKYTAYLYVRLEFDIDVFKGEPDITIRVRGLKVTDPIASTTAWSNNPALCAYDFITRSSQRGGIGVAAARIDTTSLETARDYCTTKGWTCNYPVNEQQAVSDNLDYILACYRGAIIYSEAKFKFVFADLNHETFTGIALNEDDITGIHIEMPDVSQRANAIRCTFLDRSKRFKSNDYVFSKQDLVDSEGDYRELSVPLYAFTNVELVQKMANYFLERDRYRKIASFVAKEKAKRLEPYDLFTLTHSMPGWTDKPLRVLTANILPDDTVALSCIEENTILYDDVFNITDEIYDDTELLDPNDIQSVEDISVTETDYVYRLRTFSKLEVSFNQPTNYPWFDYIRVWVSTNGMATWKHQFDTSADFEIDPVREGITYYIKLQVVNIFGTRQPFGDAPVVSAFINGNYSTAPESLSYLNASVTGNAVNLYSEKVDDPDIELYEFRLGATWSGAVFLAAFRSPNLSLNGVRPGAHTFWCNTLGSNGVYGDTPRSAVVVMPSPPHGWALSSTSGPYANVVKNGDMELNSDWPDFGSPTANSQSTLSAYEGTYGRVFVNATTGTNGIQSTAFTLTAGADYGLSFWLKPSESFVRVLVRPGDGSTVWSCNIIFSSLSTGEWNLCRTTFSEVPGGSSGQIIIYTTAPSSNRIDNVIVMRGAYSSSFPYMYNSEDFIRVDHGVNTSASTYSGQYQAFYTISSVVSGLAWVDSSYAVLGSGGNWEDVFTKSSVAWSDVLNSTKSWSELFAPSNAPKIKTKLVYGETTAYGSTVENMEILSAYVTGRYFAVRSCVVDPSYNIYGIVKPPTLRIAT